MTEVQKPKSQFADIASVTSNNRGGSVITYQDGHTVAHCATPSHIFEEIEHLEQEQPKQRL